MGKESHLNSAVNRFQLNRKRVVGNLNEMISTAMPLTRDEWEGYYITNGKTLEQLDEIGIQLYNRFRNVIIPEIESITIEDCKEYIKSLIIDKTFDGMRARFQILNTELLRETDKEFKFLPDHEEDWRYRTFRIDYYHLDVERDLLVGIKVAPNTLLTSQNPTVIRAREEIENTHRESMSKDAGYFYILYYSGKGANVKIANREIIDEIQEL
ncbi:MjaI family restriction endonuclease [candidate division WOR-3 bacterium]|nr:MjaI family restriction endonuclease [candidate division WOR-3 bacterium]